MKSIKRIAIFHLLLNLYKSVSVANVSEDQLFISHLQLRMSTKEFEIAMQLHRIL